MSPIWKMCHFCDEFMSAQGVRWVALRSEILFVHLLYILFLIFKNRLKWYACVMILWLCYLWYLPSYALLNIIRMSEKETLHQQQQQQCLYKCYREILKQNKTWTSYTSLYFPDIYISSALPRDNRWLDGDLGC